MESPTIPAIVAALISAHACSGFTTMFTQCVGKTIPSWMIRSDSIVACYRLDKTDSNSQWICTPEQLIGLGSEIQAAASQMVYTEEIKEEYHPLACESDYDDDKEFKILVTPEGGLAFVDNGRSQWDREQAKYETNTPSTASEEDIKFLARRLPSPDERKGVKQFDGSCWDGSWVNSSSWVEKVEASCDGGISDGAA